MNAALDAVRYANPNSFTDTPGIASKSAKRALLRHLADMSNWSCEVLANYHGSAKPKCSHASCRWLCFQSEPNTADEISMSESAVKRTRRALVADGWITLSYAGAGRGAITFYELNRVKLAVELRPKFEKRPTQANATRRAASTPTSIGSNTPPIPQSITPLAHTDEKESNSPPITPTAVQEGEHTAPEKGADRSEKGGNLPFPNRKNRNEPCIEPKTIALATSLSDDSIKSLYLEYPRKVAPAKAMKAIRGAIQHLGSGKNAPRMMPADALEFLLEKVRKFRNSPAGSAGEYTPHPATWFNQARYLDDETEWQHAKNQQRNDANNRGQSRFDSTLDAFRRANEADANS